MANGAFDLEAMREIFKDKRTHISVGRVTKVTVVSDRSVVLVRVEIWPEQREIITRMTWEHVGDGAGIFAYPVVNDLVLVAFADGDDDQAFVIRRLSSKQDKIPLQADAGGTVIKAMDGKTLLHVGSKIHLAKGDSEPAEPLVLGLVLQTMLTQVLEAIINAPQLGTCAVGPVVLNPQIKQQLTQIKSEFLATDSTNILSQFAFTERGDT